MSKFSSYVRKSVDPIDSEVGADIVCKYYQWRIKKIGEVGEEAFIDHDWETLALPDQRRVERARGIRD